MINRVRKLKNNFENACDKYDGEITELKSNISEISESVAQKQNDIRNVNIIISDIDKAFAEKTSINNKKDMAFLWGAVGLQCVRWILIPTLDEESLTPDTESRHDATKDGKIDRSKTGSQLDKSGENKIKGKYIDCSQIISLPVPYDAMMGTEDIYIKGVTEIGKNLYGGNHHSATWGHDPIIGHIIGTHNILTRSVSFRDAFMTTRKVDIPSGRQQIVLPDMYNILKMESDVIGTLREDIKRLPTAHLKQILHFQSDKNTHDGLPIPLLPAGMQQRLLKQKWNSKELENIINKSIKGIAKNMFIASLINTSVGILHGFCYNESKDDSLSMYAVRTRKIVATSNVISSSINVATVVGGVAIGIGLKNPDMIKKSVSHVDIGGYIETIHQVVNSKKLQESIKREFIEKELYNRLCSEEYSFLEEAHYE